MRETLDSRNSDSVTLITEPTPLNQGNGKSRLRFSKPVSVLYQRSALFISIGLIGALAWRITIAVVIGILAVITCYMSIKATPDHLPDFGTAWFGARAILSGQNPYDLVGPGLLFDWPWRNYYPATAFIAVTPLSFLSQVPATLVFVFVSFALLAYSVESCRWPMFFSMPVIVAASAGQWAPILSSAVGIPWLAFLYACKPTEGLALLFRGSGKQLRFALIGALILGGVSLALSPAWPVHWLRVLPATREIMAPPIMRTGGFVVLLALLRWRQKEARFLLALALVPAVGTWYTTVPLFLIPKTRTETMVLSMTSSLGWLAQYQFVRAASETELNAQVGAMIVLTVFLPCLVMVLRRPEVTA